MFSVKKIIAFLVISAPLLLSATQYQLSTHVLDIVSGKPAPKVKVELYKMEKNQKWKKIGEEFTKDDGRIGDFLPYNEPENRVNGIYKLKFYTKDYYISHKIDTFYPFIEVSFELSKDQKHYHVPITLSPFGYSTYRGS
ncbi:hydroxyisourate hydrolase [Campylobacter molothri]|uniref:hydroxyisourate hydrolase n=1 Tax=Campylobacter molothri TaxID=1032242 RepID=UPI001EC9329F|nr:hydroxyisourate hydrolase [Campylobacter sp. RM17709]MBZ7966346.1 hydroxyisourate hydrolase [Campylobacter sp. RM10535]